MNKEQREAVEIFDNQLRISIGIEDVEDLIAELDRVLNLIKQ